MRQRAVPSDATASAGDAHENVVTRSARRVLQTVDVYPKMHCEFNVQTEWGARVSLLAGLVMLVLLTSELHAYWRPNTHEHMVVDASLNAKLQAHVDISYLALNCRDAHMNAMDVAGELQVNMHQTMVKTRLDSRGQAIGRPIAMRKDGTASAPGDEKADEAVDACGSCYGATHPAGKSCCNTCDDVKEAFVSSGQSLEEASQKAQCVRESVEEETLAQDGEGCRFTGTMLLNRVAGNFHVALGHTFHRQGKLMHQFRPGEEYSYNSSHVIHSLSFGEPVAGVAGPLDGVLKIAAQHGGVFQYYIKIVPTIYGGVDDKPIYSYQFAVTQQSNYMGPFGQMKSLPGTFFVYDLSPFMVKVENKRMPFTHFLTKVCAIVGGVISIAGFADSFMYNSLHVRRSATGGGASKFG
ncbi:unnamed protein product [Hyaloperonospora brassicae]|uniref:Endoplasmic reticulum vesicle transporter C-terminal domain-containing protein n=1 Tax=Hyaloperonospora brassicae TaxID=162125 RepID=A0AAV0UP72_HYABA|nr:unnamed protein product [Hyaloperonospora brassicae]